jgi:putative hemolysin
MSLAPETTVEVTRAGAALPRHVPYPVSPGSLPQASFTSGSYRLEFARTEEALDEILRLRFQVFNLELGEGLTESFVTERDEDDQDRVFHHLLIRSLKTGSVVGTYRMQTPAMAAEYAGFYSAGEFEVDALPEEVLADSVEIGRACVAKDHRNGRVLHLLWRGLASYLTWNDKRYLFGCCSLTSQDGALGDRVYRYLVREGYVLPSQIAPLPGLECGEATSNGGAPMDCSIPPLFQSYLNMGAKVCGPPAIDRLFKTIDFLVLFDKRQLGARVFRTFFA